MSCCGRKRALLLQQHAQPVSGNSSVGISNTVKPNRTPRVFEYIGSGTFMLRGAVSGMTYRFERHGDAIEVAYEDSFAMLGEREIRLKP
jgi:hypothetical protein